MKPRTLCALLAVSALCLFGHAQAPVSPAAVVAALPAQPAAAQPGATDKLVRLENATDVTVRIRCIGYEQGHNFTRDLPPGKHEVVTGVDTGPRLVAVFEQGGGQIVAKKGFDLAPQKKNAIVTVRGDKADGFKVVVRYADF